MLSGDLSVMQRKHVRWGPAGENVGLDAGPHQEHVGMLLLLPGFLHSAPHLFPSFVSTVSCFPASHVSYHCISAASSSSPLPPPRSVQERPGALQGFLCSSHLCYSLSLPGRWAAKGQDSAVLSSPASDEFPLARFPLSKAHMSLRAKLSTGVYVIIFGVSIGHMRVFNGLSQY